MKRCVRLVLLLVLALVGATLARSAGAAPRGDRPFDERRYEDVLADGDLDVLRALGHLPHASPRIPAPAASIAWFSVSAMKAPSETAIFATLSVAWDRAFVRPYAAVQIADPPPPPSPEPPRPPVPVRPDAPVVLVLGPELARSVVTAALRAAGLGATDAAVDRIISRARWSALLPQVRLRGQRADNDRLSATVVPGEDPSRYYDSQGNLRTLEARLTWQLDRLVFADEEPGLERLRAEQRDARLRLSARVLEVLFQWQRAVLDRDLSAEGTRDRLEDTLRDLEAEISLDVLTQGWFSAWNTRRARSPPPPKEAKK